MYCKFTNIHYINRVVNNYLWWVLQIFGTSKSHYRYKKQLTVKLTFEIERLLQTSCTSQHYNHVKISLLNNVIDILV